jgi:hypothetical protein
MNGESLHPQTETMAVIHNIRHTTPGAIAMCAVLVSLTVDINLVPNTPVRHVGHCRLMRHFKK